MKSPLGARLKQGIRIELLIAQDFIFKSCWWFVAMLEFCGKFVGSRM